jgi:HEPN domain-containing protein
MTNQEIISYWTESSDRDYKTMLHLYETKDYYWSLFVGHLVIEKLLKSFYCKNIGTIPPKTHNLYRIAELSDLEISDEHKEILVTLTTFNIRARYDDYKQKFYKKCTQKYTQIWINKIKVYKKWLKERQ